ncbi:MAG: hypothetical protein R6X23_02785 [Acidimicrobiia bacterium]
MSSTPTTKRRRGAVAATLAVASMGLLAGFAPAASAHPGGGRAQLTDEQKTCLEEQGVVRPEPNADGERVKPTDEQKEAFKAAAEACGIEARGPRGSRPELTDEQKTCLEEQGIEKPARGEDGRRVRPTDEQKAAFEAAAAECGIELPERPSDAPSDNGTTDDTQAENADAS